MFDLLGFECCVDFGLFRGVLGIGCWVQLGWDFLSFLVGTLGEEKCLLGRRGCVHDLV